MVEIHFKVLFRVRLSHEYYAEAGNRDFRFQPTADCRALMRRGGLLFRTTVSGFVVLYEANRGGEPLKPLEADGFFRFGLYTLNAHFHHYTDLDPRRGQAGFYHFYSRLGTSFLTTAEDGKATDGDALRLRGQEFQLQWDPEDPPPIIEISGRNGVVFSQDHFSPQYPRRHIRLPEPGRYELRWHENEVFYAHDGLRQGRAFGVVELRPDGEPNAPTPRDYELRFEARRTLWRYYVVPRVETVANAAELSIDGFPAAVATVLPGNQTAYVFEADDPQALRERSPSRYQLKHHAITLVPNLPHPRRDSISWDLNDNPADKIFSDMFVYI